MSEASEPDSPTPVRHSYNQSHDSPPRAAIPATARERDDRIDGYSRPQPNRGDLSESLEDTHIDDPALTAPAQPQPHITQQTGPRPGAARYHNARQQRPVPQYKLQAKITALERSGRKDPVLRFDVYVRKASESNSN